MVEQCIQRNGLSVCDHRSRGPNWSASPAVSCASYARRCGSIRTWQRSAMACTCSPEPLSDLEAGGQLRDRGVRLSDHIVDTKVEIVNHGWRCAQGASGCLRLRASTDRGKEVRDHRAAS